MKISQSLLCAFSIVTLLGAITPPLALAQQENARQRQQNRIRNRNQASVNWEGHADKLMDVCFQQDRTWTRRVSGRKGTGDAVFSRPMPRRSLTLTLNQTLGRGRAWIRQQPSASNNYTCVVRISDRPSGGDNYKFTLRWAS